MGGRGHVLVCGCNCAAVTSVLRNRKAVESGEWGAWGSNRVGGEGELAKGQKDGHELGGCSEAGRG